MYLIRNAQLARCRSFRCGRTAPMMGNFWLLYFVWCFYVLRIHVKIQKKKNVSYGQVQVALYYRRQELRSLIVRVLKRKCERLLTQSFPEHWRLKRDFNYVIFNLAFNRWSVCMLVVCGSLGISGCYLSLTLPLCPANGVRLRVIRVN